MTSAFFANSAECRDGLVYALGGAWADYRIRNIPALLAGSVVLIFELDESSAADAYTVTFEIVTPGGEVSWGDPITLEFDKLFAIRRISYVARFGVEIGEPGIWRARVSMGNLEMACVSLEVRLEPGLG